VAIQRTLLHRQLPRSTPPLRGARPSGNGLTKTPPPSSRPDSGTIFSFIIREFRKKSVVEQSVGDEHQEGRMRIVSHC